MTAAFDRTERYSRIKAILGPVFEQAPSPHVILDQMLTDEQALLLRLNNTGQPWSLVCYTLTTVAGQAKYTIAQPLADYQRSGKVYAVFRATDDPVLPYLSIPYDDYSQADFGQMPTGANTFFSVVEKMSFYRGGAQDQSQKVVIEPAPQEVYTYKIWYFVGALDRARALMGQLGPVVELDTYLALKSAGALLPNAKWSEDRSINDEERRTRAAGLDKQLGNVLIPGTWENIVERYIRNINAPKSFEMDFWNDPVQ